MAAITQVPLWSSPLPSAPSSMYPLQEQRLQPRPHYPPSSSNPYHIQSYPVEAATRFELSPPTYSSVSTSRPLDYYQEEEKYLTDRNSQYTSHLPPQKRTRSKMYPSEEARVAAKMVQKAKRREQNRNAQRRLRDRKEEHTFKLEGEILELRRESEETKMAMEGLEEMVRRLVEERDELRRRVEGSRAAFVDYNSSASGGEGYSDREYKESSVSTSSSVSVSTPRSPHSPGDARGKPSSIPFTPNTATFPTVSMGTMGIKASPTQHMLPRIRLADIQQEVPMMASNLLPHASALQWNLH